MKDEKCKWTSGLIFIWCCCSFCVCLCASVKILGVFMLVLWEVNKRLWTLRSGVWQVGLGSILVFTSYLVVVNFCYDELRTVCHKTEKIKQYCALFDIFQATAEVPNIHDEFTVLLMQASSSTLTVLFWNIAQI